MTALLIRYQLCLISLPKAIRYPASCIRSSQAIVSPRCDHQLIFTTFLRDLSSRMPSICGTPLALTSAPLYPTCRLQQATSPNHSNLTRTAPQMNHCRPFTVQQQPACELTRQAISASPFSSRAASSEIHQTAASDGIVSRGIIPSFNPTSLRVTAHISPVPSYLSSETPFIPRFTSKHVLNSEHSGSATCNSTSPSTPATRIVPTFSKKRVQSCGNDSTKRTKTATSRVCTLGKTVQSEGASSLSSSLPPPSVIRPVTGENVSNLHKQSQQRSTQNHRSILMGQDIGLSESHGISSNFNRELSTEPNVAILPAVVHINNADVTYSDSSPVPVSKCLPQKRPRLVITQAPSTKDHLSAPFTGNVPSKQSNNGSVSPSFLGDVLVSESPFSGLVRGHPTSIQALQQRRILGQSQSVLDLTLGLQVLKPC